LSHAPQAWRYTFFNRATFGKPCVKAAAEGPAWRGYALCRSTNRCTLPLGVFGNSARNSIASVVGWARCSSRHDTIAERERHESNSSSIDQHVALRAPNMPMHQVVV
jgi:hypothetical protein